MGSIKGKIINQIKGFYYYCKFKFYLNVKKKNLSGSREIYYGKDFLLYLNQLCGLFNGKDFMKVNFSKLCSFFIVNFKLEDDGSFDGKVMVKS